MDREKDGLDKIAWFVFKLVLLVLFLAALWRVLLEDPTIREIYNYLSS